MKDADCVRFLQWALPRMGLRWGGFRKVRRGLCKRIGRRAKELRLSEISAYPAYLEAHPEEWPLLDALCRISISRFHRDRGAFEALEAQVLPEIAGAALARGESALRCWSAGCASGEEPYTLAILWELRLKGRFPALKLRVTATEADPRLLGRARRACYPASSLKELPKDWRERAFERREDGHRLRKAFSENVELLHQDIRTSAPEGPFRLVLCRNLAFTYFDHELQRSVLRRILERLSPGGFLMIGIHESLPQGAGGWGIWSEHLRIYRKEDPPKASF